VIEKELCSSAAASLAARFMSLCGGDRAAQLRCVFPRLCALVAAAIIHSLNLGAGMRLKSFGQKRRALDSI
jgi:hypothetical protein